MLLPDNISPQDCVYYNGSFVLQELMNVQRTNILDLYQLVSQKKEMSFQIFLLCLDWLFLLNEVQLEKDEVILCI